MKGVNMKLTRLIYFKFYILVASLVMIGIGFMREEQFTVLKKAVNICLECIVIG